MQARFLSPDNHVQAPNLPQNYNRYSYCLNNPEKYTDPSGEFITWSIGKNRFSIGVNFTPLGIPLGGGINIGNNDGFSLGAYGEVGYRVGGDGLGSGVFVQQSFDYNFKHKQGSATTSEGAYASFMMFNAGASASQTYNYSSKEWHNGWSVSAGLGIGNPQAGIGFTVSYGSGGWAFGLGGFYNPYAKPYYEANLNGYENIYQDDPKNCKNATLASIEKLFGGTRDQQKFKEMGEAYLNELPDRYSKTDPRTKLQPYFEHMGFSVDNAIESSYKQIGDLISTGNPVVLDMNIEGGHTMTITKIRQWTPKSNVRVWMMDPHRGLQIQNWNNLNHRGSYVFWKP